MIFVTYDFPPNFLLARAFVYFCFAGPFSLHTHYSMIMISPACCRIFWLHYNLFVISWLVIFLSFFFWTHTLVDFPSSRIQSLHAHSNGIMISLVCFNFLYSGYFLCFFCDFLCFFSHFLMNTCICLPSSQWTSFLARALWFRDASTRLGHG